MTKKQITLITVVSVIVVFTILIFLGIAIYNNRNYIFGKEKYYTESQLNAKYNDGYKNGLNTNKDELLASKNKIKDLENEKEDLQNQNELEREENKKEVAGLQEEIKYKDKLLEAYEDYEANNETVIASYYVDNSIYDVMLVQKNNSVKAPTPEKENATFLGWSIDKETIVDTTQFYFEEDTSFYALFEHKGNGRYKVTWKFDRGDGLECGDYVYVTFQDGVITEATGSNGNSNTTILEDATGVQTRYVSMGFNGTMFMVLFKLYFNCTDIKTWSVTVNKILLEKGEDDKYVMREELLDTVTAVYQEQ